MPSPRLRHLRKAPPTRGSAFIRRALLLTLTSAALATPDPAGAQERERRWSAGGGVGVGFDLRGGDQEVANAGLAAHAHVLWDRRDGPGLGLAWDGAWFDGPITRERRLLLSAVVQADLGSTPFHVRAGPGLGIMTVVEVDLPGGGLPGGGLVSIGDQGGWGATLGVGGRVPVGPGTLEPDVSLLWQRAGTGNGGAVHALTLSVGARVILGG